MKDFLDAVQGHEKSVGACLGYMCCKDFTQTYHLTELTVDEKFMQRPV